jgi:hypothetical protein
MLRTSPLDNNRVNDVSHFDKSAAKALMEKAATSYSDSEETGALIGQEMDVLRLMFELSYTEDEIELVRDGFKTKDVFFKRQIDQIKRQLMLRKKRGENTQSDVSAILSKAKEIAAGSKEELSEYAEDSKLLMAFLDWKLNA